MANKVIPMQQVRSVIQLLEKGLSLRAIAAALHLSRQTVTLYAARFHCTPHSLEELRNLPDGELAELIYLAATPAEDTDNPRRQDFKGRIPYFLSELKRIGVMRLLLWKEYRKEYKDPYQYTQFCILLKEAAKIIQTSMHQQRLFQHQL